MELSDDLIDARFDYGTTGVVQDTEAEGLRIRIGKRKCTWMFYADLMEKGTRRIVCENLGQFDRGRMTDIVRGASGETAERPEGYVKGKFKHIVDGRPRVLTESVVERYVGEAYKPKPIRNALHVSTDEARKLAAIERGKMLENKLPVNKRQQVRFEDAFAEYLLHLKEQAAERGKPPRWHANVAKLGKKHILPKWSGWTLADMSDAPKEVRLWHKKLAKEHGPTTANHCTNVIRATYKSVAKEDRRLSLANLPTTSVKMAKENGYQKGMSLADFPAWFEAWHAIPDAIRRGYMLTNLLCGARPGELARVRLKDMTDDELVIGEAKMENDISIPLTDELRAAIKIALDAQPGIKPNDLIFPGFLSQLQHRYRRELPYTGADLRRTFKTFATSTCGIADELSEVLMGHVPPGISGRYLIKWALAKGPAIREAQEKISRTMMAALRGELKGKRAA